MVIFYDKDGKRIEKIYECSWNFSQKRNREGTGKIELVHCPQSAKYAELYKGTEKIKEVVLQEYATNESKTSTSVKTLESLFKNYRIPDSWHGWDKKPLNFVLSDAIYGFDYIKKSTIEDFADYIEKTNIGLNKIKDGDIHLDYRAVGDSIHYYEQGHITFAFDCRETISQRYVRWIETTGEKVYIGVQSVSSDFPITDTNIPDFSTVPILTAHRDRENDSSLFGVPIASDKRYVAVRFILRYINADWIQDFATRKVYNQHDVLVDRTVRGFTPVIRAFEIITRKRTEFHLKYSPTDLNELVDGIDFSNSATLWDAIQKIREKYTFDTACYFEKGKVFFEFSRSLVKNKKRQSEYLLRSSDTVTQELNNTVIKELKQNIQKVNVLHCYGEGEKQQRLYVRIPETGTYDKLPTVEEIFIDTKIKKREQLYQAGMKKLKEKRNEDHPVFEVETLKSIRLFDEVSLVHPETHTIYEVIVEEENISYKENSFTQKFGIGGFLFNPLSALIKKENESQDNKILKPPAELIASAKTNAIVLEWSGDNTDFAIRWKEENQKLYNYRHTKQKQELFERLEAHKRYVFSVASVFEGEISEYTTEIRAQPLSADIEFPSDGNAIAHICFDETPQALPSVNPSYTVWQSKIVEYDCTGKQAIKMTFAEAMYNVIILSGALHNDFTLHLFFDKRSGNGAKQYQIVYKLTGNYTVTLTTDEKHTNKIAETIDENVFGSGCYVVVDFNGNVWRFKGGKGSAGGNFQNIDIAGTIDDADYFIIEKEKEIRKIEKPQTLKAVQQFDSPIGEIKAFFENDYKHGFLEANGLPFSPDVFPELSAYVKRVFNTGTESITGWPLRPKLEGTMQGTKIFIKAVQGV